jgi:hypothetical protein
MILGDGMIFLLHLATVAVTAFTLFVVAARLIAIADSQPEIVEDSLRVTNVYFLNRATQIQEGRRLIVWFWIAFVALLLSALAWLAQWPA